MNNDEINFMQADINDVDLILDMKLDIILNNKNVINMSKNELEKSVIEAEEQIRLNLTDYKIILYNNEKIGYICMIDLENMLLIDSIYIICNYRNKGICTVTLQKMVKANFKPVCIWIEKENVKLINICKNINFLIEEELENKLFLKNKNEKEENKVIKAELLCNEVYKLCKKYNMKFFFFTEGKSVGNINDSESLRKIIDKLT